MKKISGLFFVCMTLGTISCGPTKEVKSFSFISDYCLLDNKETYEVGSKVDLSLTLDSKYASAYVLPNDLNIYIGGKLAVNGTDYEYNIEDNVGKLSLTMKDNVLLRTMYNESDNIYRITSEKFEKAKSLKNFDYYQYHLSLTEISTRHFHVSLSYLISPNILYKYRISTSASDLSSTNRLDIDYYEKNNNIFTNYYGDSKGWYVPSETNEEEFNSVKDIPANRLFLVDKATFEYDDIANNFDEITKTYFTDFTYKEINYTIHVKFDHDKIVNAYYETKKNTGVLMHLSITYDNVDPVIPEEAKQGTLPR